MTATQAGFRNLITDDMPRVYGLRWHAHLPAIEIFVRKALLPMAPRLPEEIASHIAATFGLGKFEETVSDKYGFDGVLRRIEGEHVTRFIATIPVSYFVLDENCEACKGTAKNEYEDECLHCMGLGKKSEYRYKEAFAVAASIGFLLMSLEDLEWLSQTPAKQLMKLVVSPGHGPDASFLSGTFGIPLVDWLSHKGNESLLNVEDAMRIAYHHMFTRREWDSDADFHARIEGKNGWLNIICPGQGCGMAPKLDSLRRGRGYDIHSHNIDHPVQLLSILAGFAALHDVAAEQLG